MVLTMQSLRLVGPAEDGDTIVLESLDGAERFTLPLDERLRDVSFHEPPQPDTAGLPAAADPSPEPGPELTPRDIQTRVRSGQSAQAVADEAGVPLERVMRFAYPVLAERARVVDEARRSRARRGPESHPVDFGELIDARLAQHGVNPALVGWDSYRREDGAWTVVAAFSTREQNLIAKFSLALHNRSVSALDALAADLLSDRPVRALLPQQPEAVTDDVPAVGEPTAPRLSAVPDPAEPDGGLDADPSGPATPAIRPGRRQKAHTHPIPVPADEDELFDQEALNDAGSPDWQEQPLPFETGEPAVDPAAGAAGPDDGRPKRGRRGDKPRMPSWDDILLGVRHKSD